MKIHRIVLALACAAVVSGCASTSSASPSAAGRPLKVLVIGNSFSVSVMDHLPAAAKAAGCKLDICSLYIGGCSLERHCSNLDKASDPSFKPYDVWRSGQKKHFAANIPAMLATDRWDVVTIQQASHESWRPASFHPYADRLIAEIRRLAPQAEIVIQQTWAYNAKDKRIAPGGEWGFDQQGMYERLTTNYVALARQYGLRVIPTGLAVQKARVAFGAPDTVVGRGGDTIHLSGAEGEYLQACVWLSFLFNKDVTDLAYAPKGLASARAAVLRRSAQAAVAEGILK